MAASAGNFNIHFAPDDLTLPAPWKGLVDGNTGYIYYWNTETNATQYEKPLPPQLPIQAAPPLPAGSPPGSTPSVLLHTGPPHPQNVETAEMKGTIPGNLPDGGAVNPLNPVSTPGQSQHGMFNGFVHPGMMGAISQNNPHVYSGMMVPGNLYGNFSAGHPGGGHMTGSTPGGRIMMGNNSGVNHGAQMPAPGLSGAPTHMNTTDNPFGGVRPSHSGGLGGGPQGVMNMHTGAPIRNMQGGIGGNVPMQPKLAVLPVPQAMGRMHVPVQPIQMNHRASSGGPMPAEPGHFKRPVNDYANVQPEPMKRSHMQGFSEAMPPMPMDVDLYRRQHEITVMGDNIPPPLMTFEGANFPMELAREVRYLLQPGAYVVRCAAATAEPQHTAVNMWGLHPCGLSARRDIVPVLNYPAA